MGVVRKVVNYLTDTLTPKVDGAIDHLPARFNGSFNDTSRVLTMTIESQGANTENLTAEVTIPGGSGGGPTYSAGNGINITSANAIEIDTAVTATKSALDDLQAQVGDAFSQVAIGSDGKSLDFTALDGQVNNIVLPNNGSSEWTVVTVDNIASFKWKVGDILQIDGINITDTLSMVKIIGFIISANSTRIELNAHAIHHTPGHYWPAWGINIIFSTKKITFNYINSSFNNISGELTMTDISNAYTNATLN